MKKNKLEDREESDHESIANLKNSFQIYEQTRKILDHNQYHEDFSNSIYDEINIDWYSLSIYDVYFNDDYVDNDSINNNSNSSSDVSSTVIIDKLEVKCKENMKGVQYNFFC